MDNKKIGFAGENIDLGEPIIPIRTNSTGVKPVEKADWWNGSVMWLAIGITGAIAIITLGGIVWYCF
jgi:hypothetical protein